MSLQTVCLAYWPILDSKWKKTNTYSTMLAKDTRNVLFLEDMFWSFHTLMVGANDEWKPSDEIMNILESNIDEQLDSGVTHFFTHWYSVNQINIIEEYPRLQDKALKVHRYVTKFLIDKLEEKGVKLYANIGSLFDWYWDHSSIKVRWNPIERVWDLWIDFYLKHWRRFYDSIKDLRLNWKKIPIFQETSTIPNELYALFQIGDEFWIDIHQSYFANKSWLIPGPNWGIAIPKMFNDVRKKEAKRSRKQKIKLQWLNCTSREVWEKSFNYMLENDPKLAELFNYFLPNSSPWCYEWDFSEKYGENIVDFLNRLGFSFWWWCCWTKVCDYHSSLLDKFLFKIKSIVRKKTWFRV